MTRDPFHITYNDLVAFIEGKVRYMEKNYPRMKTEGSITTWTANHNIACAKILLSMLRKHKKDPQLNLYDLFEKAR